MNCKLLWAWFVVSDRRTMPSISKASLLPCVTLDTFLICLKISLIHTLDTFCWILTRQKITNYPLSMLILEDEGVNVLKLGKNISEDTISIVVWGRNIEPLQLDYSTPKFDHLLECFAGGFSTRDDTDGADGNDDERARATVEDHRTTDCARSFINI